MTDLNMWIPKKVMADYLNWYIDFFFKRDLSKFSDREKVIYYEDMLACMRAHLTGIITNCLEDERYASETEDDFDKYKELRIV